MLVTTRVAKDLTGTPYTRGQDAAVHEGFHSAQVRTGPGDLFTLKVKRWGDSEFKEITFGAEDDVDAIRSGLQGL